jgi:transposase
MTYGYSFRLAERNKEADSSLLGVRLGRVCIEEGVSVAEVANRFKVTRQTIYNWFTGASSPGEDQSRPIKNYISKLQA